VIKRIKADKSKTGYVDHGLHESARIEDNDGLEIKGWTAVLVDYFQVCFIRVDPRDSVVWNWRFGGFL
jgi:hypothetical protein